MFVDVTIFPGGGSSTQDCRAVVASQGFEVISRQDRQRRVVIQPSGGLDIPNLGGTVGAPPLCAPSILVATREAIGKGACCPPNCTKHEARASNRAVYLGVV